MKTILFILFLIFLIFLTFVWQNLTNPIHARLRPCPSSPNCVHSLDDPELQPLTYKGKDSIVKLKDLILKNFDAFVVVEEPDYLHIVCVTEKMRFRDDLEFLVNEEEGVIHFRSASRVGYSDWGVNHNRMEKIRLEWEK